MLGCIGHEEARAWIARNLLDKDGLFKLSDEDINTICKLTEGPYSEPFRAGFISFFGTLL